MPGTEEERSEVAEPVTWLMLVYRVPSEPTRLRAAVWRRLRSLGAIYLQNSAAVAHVPADRGVEGPPGPHVCASLPERLQSAEHPVRGPALRPRHDHDPRRRRTVRHRRPGRLPLGQPARSGRSPDQRRLARGDPRPGHALGDGAAGGRRDAGAPGATGGHAARMSAPGPQGALDGPAGRPARCSAGKSRSRSGYVSRY